MSMLADPNLSSSDIRSPVVAQVICHVSARDTMLACLLLAAAVD